MTDYNNAVQQFPANLIAGTLGFKTEPFYEMEPELEQAARKAPDVKFG